MLVAAWWWPHGFDVVDPWWWPRGGGPVVVGFAIPTATGSQHHAKMLKVSPNNVPQTSEGPSQVPARKVEGGNMGQGPTSQLLYPTNHNCESRNNTSISAEIGAASIGLDHRVDAGSGARAATCVGTDNMPIILAIPLFASCTVPLLPLLCTRPWHVPKNPFKKSIQKTHPGVFLGL